ncbi:MAG TPA: FAD-binding oxidoreductase [Thiolinea sp.]|nr:FAD-binding oxidoreductase [Thiolinea sp.]
MIPNGRISFWYADIGGLPPVRPSLPGDREADVCIIGAGYTGLWSAYYLKRLQPDLRIIVLEREFAGFGASGRNGGWLSGGFAWAHERYQQQGGRTGVQAMIRAMATSVDEVIRVAEREGIAADIVRTDELQVATCGAQWQRLQADFQARQSWAVAEDDCELLDAARLGSRIRVANAQGALMTRHVARVQPARLVQGLARVVEASGVHIFEQTPVTGFGAGRVQTDRGQVKADYILRATEGFTAGLPGLQRSWLPLNSAQIVTEPLPEPLWEQIGWQGQELLGDHAHAYCYAQRTREGRIAMGGRGVPYRFGSRTDVRGRTQPATIRALLAVLHRHFPMTRRLAIDHAWCGVLGVPRDWCASVGLDRQTGIGWAGGYVGVGVSTSNLAGRTLAELVLGQETERTQLPWVNHRVRDWEPEPLRWLGVHAMYRLYHLADRLEQRGGGPSALARLANRLTGR